MTSAIERILNQCDIKIQDVKHWKIHDQESIEVRLHNGVEFTLCRFQFGRWKVVFAKAA